MKKDSYIRSLNCGNNLYAHNNGSSYEHGKHCSDCGRFIEKGTLDFFMTSGVDYIYMAIWNRRVSFNRGEINEDLSSELKSLLEKLGDRNAINKMNKNEAEKFMTYTYEILAKYNISDNEAAMVLRDDKNSTLKYD